MEVKSFFELIGTVFAALGGSAALLMPLLKAYGSYILKKEFAKYEEAIRREREVISMHITVELSKIQAAASRIDIDRSNGIKQIYKAWKDLFDRLMDITDFPEIEEIQINEKYMMNYVGELRLFVLDVEPLYKKLEYSIFSNNLFLSNEVAKEISQHGIKVFDYISKLNEISFGKKDNSEQFEIIKQSIGKLKKEYVKEISEILRLIPITLRNDLYPVVREPKI